MWIGQNSFTPFSFLHLISGIGRRPLGPDSSAPKPLEKGRGNESGEVHNLVNTKGQSRITTKGRLFSEK